MDGGRSMITTLCSGEHLCCITRHKGWSVSTQGILEQPRQFVWNKTVDLHKASAEAWWENDNFWYLLHARSCLISWGWSWERWGPTRFVFKFEGPMDGGMKSLGGLPVEHLWKDLKLWVPMQQPRNLKDLEFLQRGVGQNPLLVTNYSKCPTTVLLHQLLSYVLLGIEHWLGSMRCKLFFLFCSIFGW